MPQWVEPQRHTIVIVLVCLSACLSVCVCVILQCTFLHDRKSATNKAMKVAMQLELDFLPPLNWPNFCFKALLSSYSMMCSP